jgi:methyltransferase (TIGR00027 family)
MLRIVARSRLSARMAIWYADQMAPGAPGEAIARTRYIDDYLRGCIANGIRQLVILGAGYDSRPYRFPELIGRVKVFEVDNADTQLMKIKRLKRILGSLPKHVTYVSMDLNNEKLDKNLFDSGYDRNLKTLFVWEGVTFYLTANAVDDTLAFVAKNAGQGSSIIFNYVFKSVIDRTNSNEEASKWRKAVERRGEPAIFGIEEGMIEGFLSERGFCQVENVSCDFYRKFYFDKSNRARRVLPFMPIVHAKVSIGGRE